jgi:hypothetical protein
LAAASELIAANARQRPRSLNLKIKITIGTTVTTGAAARAALTLDFAKKPATFRGGELCMTNQKKRP